MINRQAELAFSVTSPLGLPRPISPENVFGATLEYFATNQMPAPSGFLAYFHAEVFLPYANALISILSRNDPEWSLAMAEDPPRYCLIHAGKPKSVPKSEWFHLPHPPEVNIDNLLNFFDRQHAWVNETQLLDLLTILKEDLSPEHYYDIEERHPWVTEYLR